MIRKPPGKRARAASPWRTAQPPPLGEVERLTHAVLVGLRIELGREPTNAEVGERLGVRNPREFVSTVRKLVDMPLELPAREEQCLDAYETLTTVLGRAPSTREVSKHMGLSESASRYHINKLVGRGLLTPPRRIVVCSLTDAGRAYLTERDRKKRSR